MNTSPIDDLHVSQITAGHLDNLQPGARQGHTGDLGIGEPAAIHLHVLGLYPLPVAAMQFQRQQHLVVFDRLLRHGDARQPARESGSDRLAKPKPKPTRRIRHCPSVSTSIATGIDRLMLPSNGGQRVELVHPERRPAAA